MNREQAAALLPIITALANGETIQVRSSSDVEWGNVTNPTFLYPAECYRIKPKLVEGWVTVYKTPRGQKMGSLHGTKTRAENMLVRTDGEEGRVVFVREVEGK